MYAPMHALVERQAAAFPPGYGEQTRVPQILAGNISVQVVGTLFVLGRVYSRLNILGIWRSDDWVLIAAWVFATGYSVCQYGQVANGSGRHQGTVGTLANAQTSQKYAYAAVMILFFAVALPKLSICLSYMRIFHSDRVGRRLIQCLIVVLILTIVPFVIENVFTCKPLSLYWNEFRPTEKCLDDIPAFYLHGSLNVAIDLALMGILIPRILGLQLNKRKKYALMGIVMLGSLAVVAGIVRLVRVGTTLAAYSKPGSAHDGPWDMYDVSVWTSTEIYVSLVCAAAPGVKPLVTLVLPRLLGSTRRDHSRSRTTGSTGGLELSSKRKRTTVENESSLHKSSSTRGLTMDEGPYMEVGRGRDDDSIRTSEENGSQPRPEGGIMKKSEIVVHTGRAR